MPFLAATAWQPNRNQEAGLLLMPQRPTRPHGPQPDSQTDGSPLLFATADDKASRRNAQCPSSLPRIVRITKSPNPLYPTVVRIGRWSASMVCRLRQHTHPSARLYFDCSWIGKYVSDHVGWHWRETCFDIVGFEF